MATSCWSGAREWSWMSRRPNRSWAWEGAAKAPRTPSYAPRKKWMVRRHGGGDQRASPSRNQDSSPMIASCSGRSVVWPTLA